MLNRSVTPCGVWEWSIPGFLSVCRRHDGIFELVCHEVIRNVRIAHEREPDSFPSDYMALVQVTQPHAKYLEPSMSNPACRLQNRNERRTGQHAESTC